MVGGILLRENRASEERSSPPTPSPFKCRMQSGECRVGGAEAEEFTRRDGAAFGCNEIAKAVGRAVSADAFCIGVHFQNVLRPIRIVLQRRQALDQSSAALVKKRPSQGGFGEHAPPREHPAVYDKTDRGRGWTRGLAEIGGGRGQD